MNEYEKAVQKNVISLIKYLPNHLTIWNTTLEDVSRPLQILSNQCEQLRHVDSVYIEWIENFKEIQGYLSNKIAREISDTLLELKLKINYLRQVNNDLKNKVYTLERSSLKINWNSNSEIINGTAVQPPLTKLLKYSLQFLTFFLRICDNINESFNTLDVKRLQSVHMLLEAFKINVTDQKVTYLIAITQYIDNEKNLN